MHSTCLAHAQKLGNEGQKLFIHHGQYLYPSHHIKHVTSSVLASRPLWESVWQRPGWTQTTQTLMCRWCGGTKMRWSSVKMRLAHCTSRGLACVQGWWQAKKKTERRCRKTRNWWWVRPLGTVGTIKWMWHASPLGLVQKVAMLFAKMKSDFVLQR